MQRPGMGTAYWLMPMACSVCFLFFVCLFVCFVRTVIFVMVVFLRTAHLVLAAVDLVWSLFRISKLSHKGGIIS